jgi:hypothetical protein
LVRRGYVEDSVTVEIADGGGDRSYVRSSRSRNNIDGTEATVSVSWKNSDLKQARGKRVIHTCYKIKIPVSVKVSRRDGSGSDQADRSGWTRVECSISIAEHGLDTGRAEKGTIKDTVSIKIAENGVGRRQTEKQGVSRGLKSAIPIAKQSRHKGRRTLFSRNDQAFEGPPATLVTRVDPPSFSMPARK